MSIRFKFKSDHEYEDLELAGASSISCGDLKQAILDKRMNGSGGAFGLLLTNATTGEEIQAEAEVLAATTVNVKRVPLSRVMSAMPSAADTARSNLSSCQPSNAFAIAGSTQAILSKQTTSIKFSFNESFFCHISFSFNAITIILTC